MGFLLKENLLRCALDALLACGEDFYTWGGGGGGASSGRVCLRVRVLKRRMCAASYSELSPCEMEICSRGVAADI